MGAWRRFQESEDQAIRDLHAALLNGTTQETWAGLARTMKRQPFVVLRRRAELGLSGVKPWGSYTPEEDAVIRRLDAAWEAEARKMGRSAQALRYRSSVLRGRER